jgi:hypothetical protein
MILDKIIAANNAASKQSTPPLRSFRNFFQAGMASTSLRAGRIMPANRTPEEPP